MDDALLLDAIEKYLSGAMTEEEKTAFEAYRRAHAHVDHAVVEHQMFLKGLNYYGSRKGMKHKMVHLHQQLEQNGEIPGSITEKQKAPIVRFWERHKRTIAVAASIACITALSISGIMSGITPQKNQDYLQQLSRKMSQIEGMQREQSKKINQLIDSAEVAGTKAPDMVQKSGGTSFLIDEDGYLVTNAHVVEGASTLIVVNKGKEYIASKVYTDKDNDLAILKIKDKDWKKSARIPYDIRKNMVDLGEEVYTLGYPRNEIVYNKGYMSASTGYMDDSASIQLTISANPGNSGGPVLDKNGSIVGILSTRDKQSNEVVFASKASNLAEAIEALKKDSAHRSLNAPRYTSLKKMDRVQQVKRIQDFVFLVKGY